MEYVVGQVLKWIPDNGYDKPTEVTVTELRRKGAKLSNGWVVDEDGIAEGTHRIRGGVVTTVAPVVLTGEEIEVVRKATESLLYGENDANNFSGREVDEIAPEVLRKIGAA